MIKSNRLRICGSMQLALLVLLFLFPHLLEAQSVLDIVTDRFEEVTGRGLLIRSNPAGARVFINGIERGLTPIAFENLGAGEHSVRLVREGFRERHFNVTLFAYSRLKVSVLMEEESGFVSLSVQRAEGANGKFPFVPNVFIGLLGEDNVELSNDNTAFLNLPSGLRTIRVRAFGWEEVVYSVLVETDSLVNLDITMTPAVFEAANFLQNRRRFNPHSTGAFGSVQYRFKVSAFGTGTFSVLNKSKNIVYERELSVFDTWLQFVTWNGRDNNGNLLPQGLYTVIINAYPFEFSPNAGEAVTLSLVTEITYALNIFPLSLFGESPGLIFAPVPHVLPRGSFQIEAALFPGGLQEDRFLSSLPFKAGLRLSPVNNLEFFAFFNFTPRFEDSALWGIGGSAKYNFFDGSGSLPLVFSLAASYTWVSKDAEAALSLGQGVGLFLPLSIELNSLARNFLRRQGGTEEARGNFSVIFSPGVFWTGPDSGVPDMLISFGVFYRGAWFNTGLSGRGQFNLTSGENPKMSYAAEVRFFPPPSNLVLSFSAGMWTYGSYFGFFGGFGIGIIY